MIVFYTWTVDGMIYEYGQQLMQPCVSDYSYWMVPGTFEV